MAQSFYAPCSRLSPSFQPWHEKEAEEDAVVSTRLQVATNGVDASTDGDRCSLLPQPCGPQPPLLSHDGHQVQGSHPLQRWSATETNGLHPGIQRALGVPVTGPSHVHPVVSANVETSNGIHRAAPSILRMGAFDMPCGTTSKSLSQGCLDPQGADAGAGSLATAIHSTIAKADSRDKSKIFNADSGSSRSKADAWGTFKAKAEGRAGIPLAPPTSKGRSGSVPKPQLRTGHVPVLLNETLDALLAPGLPGIYVDGTFGRGGHSAEILKRLPSGGRLVAFDVDPSAIAVGKELERMDPRFRIFHRPFGDIGEVLAGEHLAGAMIDIGFSSPQVDEQHRGFSVCEDGPLDLRMNPHYGVPVSQWLLGATAEEVAWVIREWGEDDDPVMSLRIADAILEKQRQCGPYTSTLDIAEVIRQTKFGLDDRGQHPAKLSFQAMRVFINHEMPQLTAFMNGAAPLMQHGARLVVITFKRPEATVVKKFLREHELPHPLLESSLDSQRLAELYPLLLTAKRFSVRQACPALVPTQAEIAINRRSRSSMVHVLECLARSPPAADRTCSCDEEARPLSQLFRRPRSTWQPAGHNPVLAVMPPRTSGSVAPTLLAESEIGVLSKR